MRVLFPNLGLFSRDFRSHGTDKTALPLNDRADDG